MHTEEWSKEREAGKDLEERSGEGQKRGRGEGRWSRKQKRKQWTRREEDTRRRTAHRGWCHMACEYCLASHRELPEHWEGVRGGGGGGGACLSH